MGAISQTKLGQLIMGAWDALFGMLSSEDFETVDEAIQMANRDNPGEAKQNEKIAKALEYQTQMAEEREKRVTDVTPAFGDENSEQKLSYLQVETQKVETKKMVERQKEYEQAIKEEKQKIRRR